ncbi:BZ3500_MvSof-1268-A1-R1_Chr3-1g05566 [Microbotryum saponariae]|uniref:BZ3500_MvSof-1268-A1-R1_Chr3-1g05566 protein n=1 Tax=Microbotryum saponariae TaxID=289078 RepID=A0A2X0KZZ7_9BASI|nr:BZ3500_MvSof-1268-A1-R1_Chr3-1g05566 [Microbotryum saponariae]SDA04756.1 BZ3501_MvSof-1269-A2-R1_Chr3-1g05236 [Microbotryum saponariae]
MAISNGIEQALTFRGREPESTTRARERDTRFLARSPSSFPPRGFLKGELGGIARGCCHSYSIGASVLRRSFVVALNGCRAGVDWWPPGGGGKRRILVGGKVRSQYGPGARALSDRESSRARRDNPAATCTSRPLSTGSKVGDARNVARQSSTSGARVGDGGGDVDEWVFTSREGKVLDEGFARSHHRALPIDRVSH